MAAVGGAGGGAVVAAHAGAVRVAAMGTGRHVCGVVGLAGKPGG
jgi:hypothetical protein